jgi:uncharacterized protein (DUF2345 family)
LQTGWLVIELKTEDGRPVANARYMVALPDGTNQAGTLDAQGQARIEGIASGDYALTFPDLDANDWGMADETGGGTPEQPEQPDPPDLQVSRLAIDLVDEDGRPVIGARYIVSLPDGTVYEGALDEQGQAQIEGTIPATYTLTFPDLDAGDWGRFEEEEETTPEGPGEPEPPDEQTEWLVIELIDEDGRPAAGARYVVTLPDGTVYEGVLNEEGQAQVKAVVVGSYTLTFPDFDAGDWDTAETEEESPLEPEQPISQPNWLLIELVDENGRSVPDIRYTLTLPDGTIHEGTLDEQGQAWLENLPIGDLILTFPDVDGRDLGTPPSEPARQTGWLAIELKAEDGQAVANARYALTLPDGTIYEDTLDDQGQARIENLESGNYTLSFPDLDVNDWTES